MNTKQNAQPIPKGTKITANGGLWTVTGCGNGRYTVRGLGQKRSYSLPCDELHADLAAGRAFLANPSAYAPHEISGRAYTNAMNNVRAALARIGGAP